MTKEQIKKAKKRLIGRCLPNGSVIFNVTFDSERKNKKVI